MVKWSLHPPMHRGSNISRCFGSPSRAQYRKGHVSCSWGNCSARAFLLERMHGTASEAYSLSRACREREREMNSVRDTTRWTPTPLINVGGLVSDKEHIRDEWKRREGNECLNAGLNISYKGKQRAGSLIPSTRFEGQLLETSPVNWTPGGSLSASGLAVWRSYVPGTGKLLN